MININICDDSQQDIEVLKNELEKYGIKKHKKFDITTFIKPELLSYELQDNKLADIYILDVSMPGKNGFELAEEDMKMRGPGDLEGTQQSGLPISLNIASLAKDGLILNAARDCADAVLKADPDLSSDRNQLLRKELRKDKYQIKDYSKIS